MALQTFLKNQTEKIQNIEKVSLMAWWNLATLGDEKFAQELQDAKIAMRQLFSNSEDYQFLLSQPKTQDPLVNRQVTLLLHSYRENQIPQELIKEISTLETEVESIYTNFRPIIKDKPVSNNDLKKILVESKNSADRQEAWEASKLIGEQVESNVLTLIKLRNESATKAGFKDFYSMSLELQELDQTRLFKLLNELEQATNAHWKQYKEQLDTSLAEHFGISTDALKPWHYQDPFFQEAPKQKIDLDSLYVGKDIVEMSRAFYEAIGLPADDVIARSDLFERDKKSQHAFCSCLDRKQDVRILCNLRDNEFWMSVQLHELGHAVYDKYIDAKLPFLLRTPPHTSTTEASAMLFGRFSKDGDFLQRYVGISSQKATELDAQTRNQNAANLLVFARWALVMIHFEQAMYQQPGIDLNRFWWDCVERFQGVKRVKGRNKPDWASKLHLACAPVYYQNYVLGELTASQLFHCLQRRLKARNEHFNTSKDVGHFLKTRLYSLGAQHPWEETLQHATGETLNPHYFSLDVQMT